MKITLVTVQTMVAGVYFLTSVYLIEIFLSSLVHVYKLSTKVFLLSLVYLIIGTIVGSAFGILLSFVIFLRKRINQTIPNFSQGIFVICGFLWFYVLVVVNANHLPESSIISAASLVLILVLTVFCVPIFILLHMLDHKDGSELLSGKTISLIFSMSVILGIMNFFLRIQFNNSWSGIILTGIMGFAYLLATMAVILLESFFMNWFIQRQRKVAEGRIWASTALIKIIVVVLGTAFFFHAKSPKRIITNAMPDSSVEVKDLPNIILIILDTVRQDRLTIYGCERDTSPNITKFAKDGLIFDAYSTSNWTVPSHATIVTGLYPTENGAVPHGAYRIDEKNETLAEILVRQGYKTGAIIANSSALSIDSGLPQGFSYYLTDIGDFLPPVNFFGYYFLLRFRPYSEVLRSTLFMRASSVNRAAINWMEENSASPFFLLLNYMDAHDPYVPPSPYNKTWNSHGLSMNFFQPWAIFTEYFRAVNAGLRHAAKDECEYLLSQYDGEITYLDDQIGRLFKKMKELNLYNNSIIVITSDHGEFFGEHGLMQHIVGIPYQVAIHVPLIVKLPDGNEQKVTPPDGPVSLVHLFHSILNWINIPHTSGRKDVDLFKGETAPIIAECHMTRRELADRFGQDAYSIIDGNIKLIIRSVGQEEFFNIEADPAESRDLREEICLEDDAVCATLKTYLNDKIRELNANSLHPRKQDVEKSRKIQERLRALGYLQ